MTARFRTWQLTTKLLQNLVVLCNTLISHCGLTSCNIPASRSACRDREQGTTRTYGCENEAGLGSLEPAGASKIEERDGEPRVAGLDAGAGGDGYLAPAMAAPMVRFK